MSNLPFISKFWRNPCQPLGEPRGSVEPRQKYTAIHHLNEMVIVLLQVPSVGQVHDFDQLVNRSNCNARLTSSRFILFVRDVEKPIIAH